MQEPDFRFYALDDRIDRKDVLWRLGNRCAPMVALARARDHLRELTAARYCFVPLPHLIARINRYLVGWQAYFRVGYPRRSYRHLNHHARRRLACHLRRRSQRPFCPPEGVTLYRHLADLGLMYL